MLHTMNRAVDREQVNKRLPVIKGGKPLSENKSNKILYYKDGSTTNIDNFKPNKDEEQGLP